MSQFVILRAEKFPPSKAEKLAHLTKDKGVPGLNPLGTKHYIYVKTPLIEFLARTTQRIDENAEPSLATLREHGHYELKCEGTY